MIADQDGQMVASAEVRDVQLSPWVSLASRLLTFEGGTMHDFAPGQSVDEMALSTSGPIPLLAGYFVLLVFDPRASSFMRRRLEVERFVSDISASAGEKTSALSPASTA
jgi:hypothetical protein